MDLESAALGLSRNEFLRRKLEGEAGDIDEWNARIERGLVRLSTITRLELGFSARSGHRAPSIPDLVIAATAEKAGLAVLAVDTDFDLVAEITGQPVEALSTAESRWTISDSPQDAGRNADG